MNQQLLGFGICANEINAPALDSGSTSQNPQPPDPQPPVPSLESHSRDSQYQLQPHALVPWGAETIFWKSNFGDEATVPLAEFCSALVATYFPNLAQAATIATATISCTLGLSESRRVSLWEYRQLSGRWGLIGSLYAILERHFSCQLCAYDPKYNVWLDSQALTWTSSSSAHAFSHIHTTTHIMTTPEFALNRSRHCVTFHNVTLDGLTILQTPLLPPDPNTSDLLGVRLLEIGRPLRCCGAVTNGTYSVIVEFEEEVSLEQVARVVPRTSLKCVWAEVGMRQLADSLRASAQRVIGHQCSGLLSIQGLGQLQAKAIRETVEWWMANLEREHKDIVQQAATIMLKQTKEDDLFQANRHAWRDHVIQTNDTIQHIFAEKRRYLSALHSSLEGIAQFLESHPHHKTAAPDRPNEFACGLVRGEIIHSGVLVVAKDKFEFRGGNAHESVSYSAIEEIESHLLECSFTVGVHVTTVYSEVLLVGFCDAQLAVRTLQAAKETFIEQTVNIIHQGWVLVKESSKFQWRYMILTSTHVTSYATVTSPASFCVPLASLCGVVARSFRSRRFGLVMHCLDPECLTISIATESADDAEAWRDALQRSSQSVPCPSYFPFAVEEEGVGRCVLVLLPRQHAIALRRLHAANPMELSEQWSLSDVSSVTPVGTYTFVVSFLAGHSWRLRASTNELRATISQVIDFGVRGELVLGATSLGGLVSLSGQVIIHTNPRSMSRQLSLDVPHAADLSDSDKDNNPTIRSRFPNSTNFSKHKRNNSNNVDSDVDGEPLGPDDKQFTPSIRNGDLKSSRSENFAFKPAKAEVTKRQSNLSEYSNSRTLKAAPVSVTCYGHLFVHPVSQTSPDPFFVPLLGVDLVFAQLVSRGKTDIQIILEDMKIVIRCDSTTLRDNFFAKLSETAFQKLWPLFSVVPQVVSAQLPTPPKALSTTTVLSPLATPMTTPVIAQRQSRPSIPSLLSSQDATAMSSTTSLHQRPSLPYVPPFELVEPCPAFPPTFQLIVHVARCRAPSVSSSKMLLRPPRLFITISPSSIPLTLTACVRTKAVQATDSTLFNETLLAGPFNRSETVTIALWTQRGNTSSLYAIATAPVTELGGSQVLILAHPHTSMPKGELVLGREHFGTKEIRELEVVTCETALSKSRQHVMVIGTGLRDEIEALLCMSVLLVRHLKWRVTMCTEIRYKNLIQNVANLIGGPEVLVFQSIGGDTVFRIFHLARRARGKRVKLDRMLAHCDQLRRALIPQLSVDVAVSFATRDRPSCVLFTPECLPAAAAINKQLSVACIGLNLSTPLQSTQFQTITPFQALLNDKHTVAAPVLGLREMFPPLPVHVFRWLTHASEHHWSVVVVYSCGLPLGRTLILSLVADILAMAPSSAVLLCHADVVLSHHFGASWFPSDADTQAILSHKQSRRLLETSEITAGSLLASDLCGSLSSPSQCCPPVSCVVAIGSIAPVMAHLTDAACAVVCVDCGPPGQATSPQHEERIWSKHIFESRDGPAPIPVSCAHSTLAKTVAQVLSDDLRRQPKVDDGGGYGETKRCHLEFVRAVRTRCPALK